MNLLSISTLTTLFDFILHASLLSAVGVVLVLIIRWGLGRRLAPAARSWLWLPVALLCLCPRLPGVVSWNVSADVLPLRVMEVPTPEQKPTIVVRGEPRPLSGNQNAEPLPAMPVARLSMREKVSIGWGVGSIAITVFWLVAYARLWRRIYRHQQPVDKRLAAEFQACSRISGFRRAPELLVSQAVESPAVGGLLRPVVLMPPRLAESLGEEALRHVLLHELAHLRKKDLWLHWMSAVVVALHWFNPFVWIASRKFRGDRESACDATVIEMGGKGAHAYGQTLLTLETRVPHPISLRLMAGILGGADLVRQRIVDITRLGKTSRPAAWFAFLAVLGGTAVIAIAAAEQAAPNATPRTAQEAAPTGPSNELYTRTYRVTPDFLTWTQTSEEPKSQTSANGKTASKTAIEVLKNLGVNFPEGASAAFIPSTSQLIARNTTGNLNFIKDIVDARLNTPVRQVHVRTHLVVFKEGSTLPLFAAGVFQPRQAGVHESLKEGTGPLLRQPAGTRSDMSVTGVLTDPQFQVLLRRLVKKPSTPFSLGGTAHSSLPSNDLSSMVEAVISLPTITARSEHRATLEVAREFIYPTEYDRQEPVKQGESAQYVPKKFEMRPIGFRMEIDPFIAFDGRTLDLDLAPDLQGFMGWVDAPLADSGKVKTPTFSSHTGTVKTSVSILDGQTIAFGGQAYVAAFLMNPSLQGEQALISKKYSVMVFVTAMMIDPSGNPVKKEAPKVEKSDASEKAPSSTPSTGGASAALGGPSVSRAVIDVGPGVVYTGQPGEDVVAKFVQAQIELLQSPEFRKRATDRTETYHPYVAPVPVTLTARRMSKTTQVEVTVSGTSADYTRFFLKSLLEVLNAQRIEVKDGSILGVLGTAVRSLLEKEREVAMLESDHKRAISRNAPQEKVDKLKKDLESKQEAFRVSQEKFRGMNPDTILRENIFFELQILEHPTSAQTIEK